MPSFTIFDPGKGGGGGGRAEGGEGEVEGKQGLNFWVEGSKGRATIKRRCRG